MPAATLMASDGLHMGDGGYAALADEVAREITRDSGWEPVTLATARASVAPAPGTGRGTLAPSR